MLHTNAMMACKTFNTESDQHHLGEIRHDGTVRGRVVITMPCHRQSLAMLVATFSFRLAFGLNVTVAVESALLNNPFVLVGGSGFQLYVTINTAESSLISLSLVLMLAGYGRSHPEQRRCHAELSTPSEFPQMPRSQTSPYLDHARLSSLRVTGAQPTLAINPVHHP